MDRIKKYVDAEILEADSKIAIGDLSSAFRHLERAHVLGQASTFHHTRVHLRMFRLALMLHSARVIWGQFIRIIGAATKTPLGIYPTGNTGGADVWFFKPMPVPDDLQEILNQAKIK